MPLHIGVRIWGSQWTMDKPTAQIQRERTVINLHRRKDCYQPAPDSLYAQLRVRGSQPIAHTQSQGLALFAHTIGMLPSLTWRSMLQSRWYPACGQCQPGWHMGHGRAEVATSSGRSDGASPHCTAGSSGQEQLNKQNATMSVCVGAGGHSKAALGGITLRRRISSCHILPSALVQKTQQGGTPRVSGPPTAVPQPRRVCLHCRDSRAHARRNSGSSDSARHRTAQHMHKPLAGRGSSRGLLASCVYCLRHGKVLRPGVLNKESPNVCSLRGWRSLKAALCEKKTLPRRISAATHCPAHSFTTKTAQHTALDVLPQGLQGPTAWH